MVNFVLALGGFFLEWFLGWLFLALIYVFLRQYLLTRYLIAYPGMLLALNIAGWILSFCIYLMYAIGGTFYSSFIEDVPYQVVQNRAASYILFLEKALMASTVIMSALGLYFILNEEKLYWETKRQKDPGH
jgi:hypothetical protein